MTTDWGTSKVTCKEFNLSGYDKDDAEHIFGGSTPSTKLTGEICLTNDVFTYIKIASSYNADATCSLEDALVTVNQSIDTSKDEYVCGNSHSMKIGPYTYNAKGFIQRKHYVDNIESFCTFHPSLSGYRQQKTRENMPTEKFDSLVEIIRRTTSI